MTDQRAPILSVTIHDCEVQTFTAGGKGGQNQNRRSTGVRITHPPSGATGEARDSRSQLQNKRAAWGRMCRSERFVAWRRRVVAALPAVNATDLLVEVRKDGHWVPADVR